MDNIYEEYKTINNFEEKLLDGHEPSLGKAVDNSVVYIMDENLTPKKVFFILITISLSGTFNPIYKSQSDS